MLPRAAKLQRHNTYRPWNVGNCSSRHGDKSHWRHSTSRQGSKHNSNRQSRGTIAARSSSITKREPTNVPFRLECATKATKRVQRSNSFTAALAAVLDSTQHDATNDAPNPKGSAVPHGDAMMDHSRGTSSRPSAQHDKKSKQRREDVVVAALLPLLCKPHKQTRR